MKNALTGTDKDFPFFEMGWDLTDEEAIALDESTVTVADNQSQCIQRLKLLGYYWNSHDNVEKWLDHSVWMIENRPSDWNTANLPLHSNCTDRHVDLLASHWMEAVDKNPVSDLIVGRAAQFFQHTNSLLSETMYLRAIKLSPSNPEWLLGLTDLQMNLADAAQDRENKYIALTFDSADSTLKVLEHRGERVGLLTRLSNFALTFERMLNAERYSKMLMDIATDVELPRVWFDANTFLGRVSIMKKNRDEAI